MTKADIVEALYQKIGFSKKEAADLVEMVFDTIKSTLSQGQKIKISGFGNFVLREKRSRVGRNPQTGQSIEISARRVLTFRPSQVLRAEVNSSAGSGKRSSSGAGLSSAMVGESDAE
ncbi:MAG: integration host factor subunit alpha [Bdellovibrionota bacterium]